MGRDHLNNDEFFTRLAYLFEYTRTKGHGSVYLVQKRMTFNTSATPPPASKIADDPLWDTHPEEPLPVLIRAHNNKSEKKAGTDREDIPKMELSTVVKPDDLDGFYARYAETCKAGMSGLKRRDKKKAKKTKKKKKGETKV